MLLTGLALCLCTKFKYMIYEAVWSLCHTQVFVKTDLMTLGQVRAWRDCVTFCKYWKKTALCTLSRINPDRFLKYLIVTMRWGYTRSDSATKYYTDAMQIGITDCSWLEMLSNKLCPFGYNTNTTPLGSNDVRLPKWSHL